jgi:hypothetical protein
VKPFLLLATHAEDAAADNEYESSPGARAGKERGHAASGPGGDGRMEAAVGDRLHVHGNVVGHPERTGEMSGSAERAEREGLLRPGDNI